MAQVKNSLNMGTRYLRLKTNTDGSLETIDHADIKTDVIGSFTAGGDVSIESPISLDQIKTDLISEKTLAAGVTVDGVLLKDSNVTATDVSASDVISPLVTLGLNATIDDSITSAGRITFTFDGGDWMEYDKATNVWAIRLNGNPNPDLRVTLNSATDVISLDSIGNELLVGQTNANYVKLVKPTTINTASGIDPSANIDFLIEKAGAATLIVTADNGGLGGTNPLIQLISMDGAETMQIGTVGPGDGFIDVLDGHNLALRTGGTLGLWSSGQSANITLAAASSLTCLGSNQNVLIHQVLETDTIDEFQASGNGTSFLSEIYLPTGGSPFSHYEFNTTKLATFAGPFTIPQNITIHQSRIGSVVFLTIPSATGVAAAAAVANAALATIDVNFRPLNTISNMVVNIVENGAEIAGTGICSIYADGSIDIFKEGTKAVNWGAIGNNGWNQFTISYSIV